MLLADLWTPHDQKKKLGYGAAIALFGILMFSCARPGCPLCVASAPHFAFNNMFVTDSLAFFFKWLFIIAAIVVLIITAEFSSRIEVGISGILFHHLVCFDRHVVRGFGQ